MGRHVILEAENQENCFKCISIVSKSANVLQIHTNGVNNQERCYASEDEARQSCPSQQVIVQKMHIFLENNDFLRIGTLMTFFIFLYGI